MTEGGHLRGNQGCRIYPLGVMLGNPPWVTTLLSDRCTIRLAALAFIGREHAMILKWQLLGRCVLKLTVDYNAVTHRAPCLSL